MNAKIPDGKLKRGLITTATAAKVGTNILGYLAKKPFLSEQGREAAKNKADRANAETVFNGLSLLRGTALKIGQMLSMELEMVPEPVRRELEKSYNQVPPMNRILARKAAMNGLNAAPEEVFKSFDSAAFAAASLGQVHAAESPDGESLAVKVQYPGVNRTIRDDMRMVKTAFRGLPDYSLLAPAFDEIEARLMEEIDYEREARNMAFFNEHLQVDGVRTPEPWLPGCGKTVLSATRMSGTPLNQWIESSPGRAARDTVARQLHEIFLESFYNLRRIHADPNPGNYIVGSDLSVGLVDFGCVKDFDEEFTENYRSIISIVVHGRREDYFALLRRMRFIQGEISAKDEDAVFGIAYRFGRWLGRLFEVETFDFEKNPGFIAEGREISRAMLKHRRHFSMNPDFIFLDRTRYGLLRIFEKLKCRVQVRNPMEWDRDTHSAK